MQPWGSAQSEEKGIVQPTCFREKVQLCFFFGAAIGGEELSVLCEVIERRTKLCQCEREIEN